MPATALPADAPAHAAILSADQLAFFDAFGFIRLPGLVADRIDAVIAAFDDVWASRGGGHDGKRHDHRRRSCIVPFIDQHPVLCALLDDPRIHGVASRILGDDFNYMGSDGNFYTGDTTWHSDGWNRVGIRFIKFAFYLDPLTPETGALRVIPGSHRPGDRYSEQLQEHVGGNERPFGLHGSEIPAYSATLRPGDIMIFDHNTKHSAFGGGSNRRMFTINLCQRWPDDRLGELQDYLAGHARFLIERNVGPIMLETAGPQRLRHLEQVMANDGKLTARTRELRAQGVEPARG